jgi:hypothetical protein
MALTLYRFEGTDLVDHVAERWCDFKLTISYQHPRILTFTALTGQTEQPINHGEGIRLFDSNYSATIPIFEGFIENIKPGQQSNEVLVTAYGADYRAGEECVITNGIATLPTAIPRAVYNVTVDADEDKGFEQLTYPRSSTPYGETAQYATIGQIIADLLDNQAPLLRDFWAAPEDENDEPYSQAELDSLDFQPQEKLVFESESITSGIQRLMQLYPAKRLFFDLETRLWRIHSPIESGAEVTLTLNQGPSATHPVLSWAPDFSLERRYTAFTLVGKPETAFADISVGAGTLTEFPEGGGTMEDFCRRWQVTDPAKRHIFRLMRPNQWIEINIPFGGGYILTYLLFDHCALLASWDAGDTWEIIPEFKVQISTGVIETPTYLFRRSGSPSPSPPGYIYTPPDDVRFVFNYFSQALSIRHPPAGYSGTAFSEFGIRREKKLYHELLNTGYADWDTVTAAYKQTHYRKLAEEVHKAYSAPVYQGGCTLLGIDYQFIGLNKRINFTSAGANGGTQTIGWESARAVLTDVEYDFAEDRTTLTFSSDMMQFGGGDVEYLRRKLKLFAKAEYKQTFVFGWTIGNGEVNISAGVQEEKIGEIF